MIAENHETARDLARNLVRWFGPMRGLAWVDDRCLWFGIAPPTYRVEREFYSWVRRYVRDEIKKLDAAGSHAANSGPWSEPAVARHPTSRGPGASARR